MSAERERAVVMGLGRFGGGVATTRHLVELGYAVTVTDTGTEETLAESLAQIADLDVRLVLGRHDPSDFENARLVVANPAVPPDAPLLRLARERGARIGSELELFLEAAPAEVALVTGTQGKSSTAALLADFLRADGRRRVHLGGNIGHSLLPELGSLSADDICVVEVSSYQLEALPTPVPRGRASVAAVTRILVDHLERHRTAARYAAAKARILELLGPGGTAILPGDDVRVWGPEALSNRHAWAHGPEVCAEAEGRASGRLTLRAGRFELAREGEITDLGEAADLALPAFQRENALVALGAAVALGVEPATLRAGLRSARGLKHRLEDLGTVAGHRVYDNAVSTTPDSTLSALRSVAAPFTWLCGGAAKDLPLDALVAEAARRCKRAIAFGRDGERFAEPLREAGVEVVRVTTVREAVAQAFARMEPGEALLFSPACASFDAYANFRERAHDFRAALPEPIGTRPIDPKPVERRPPRGPRIPTDPLPTPPSEASAP